MKQLPQKWIMENGKLVREFKFQDFREALAFINKVGTVAEAQNHHPEIVNSYNTVMLKCQTHDSDSITIQDYALAEGINSVLL